MPCMLLDVYTLPIPTWLLNLIPCCHCRKLRPVHDPVTGEVVGCDSELHQEVLPHGGCSYAIHGSRYACGLAQACSS